ncbi:hypothetical protein [Rubinisphaera brasiliensis]|uniref:Uncharacterized protein n=1 Tax=Rubinisphaera brasiliensis (strain ATCC 49424 / DSM 5305 / JCM 21570 / IAM 15109 / NBRC 103401 / IFAM 1448) TaxID=756272 RepID=F0STF4_RUBBR|nr:hypothetical protein [Rubinisphaera brasiliensis]ADY60416.1 hypothetical protein Plabr_2817 [Rubinisphaera brasiliensis DSM 5305]
MNASANDKPSLRGWLALLTVICAVVLLWGFVFPAWTASPQFRQRQALREEQGIDLAAFFYTDLDSIENRQHLDAMREQQPWALWFPWSSKVVSPTNDSTAPTE